MPQTNVTIVTIVITALVLFLANTAVTNRTSISVQKSLDSIAASLDHSLQQDTVHKEILQLKYKLTELRGSHEKLVVC